MKTYSLGSVLGVLGLALVASCAPAASGPSVKFASPKNGETVTNPITLKFTVVGVTLIPAATPSAAGQGHLHVIVDVNPPAAGQAVPRDDNNIHIGTGASELQLPKPLSPGKHKLVVVFTDSSHIVTSPPIMDTIEINVGQ